MRHLAGMEKSRRRSSAVSKVPERHNRLQKGPRGSAAASMSEMQRSRLEQLVRAHTTRQAIAQRARMVLLCAEGLSARAVARRCGASPATVAKWRTGYAARGLEGLRDLPRSGRPPKLDSAQLRRATRDAILHGGPGPRHWTMRRFAARYGISPASASRLIRAALSNKRWSIEMR